MRYVVVADLGSGLRATFGKRGRVDWRDEETAKWFMSQMDKGAGGPVGYRVPDYGLFGSKSVVGHIDPVVALRIVEESEWSAAEHHTVPFPIAP